jgi:hypothetical protein
MMFKRRISSYEGALSHQDQGASSVFSAFQQREERAGTLIDSFFTLFKEPSKLNSVMDDLNSKIKEEIPKLDQ